MNREGVFTVNLVGSSKNAADKYLNCKIAIAYICRCFKCKLLKLFQ